MRRLLLATALSLLPALAQAFGLEQLAAQLGKPAVVRGEFVQQKFLRALEKPLTSRGAFVLAKGHGLLWLLKTPLQQDYRIDEQGIARREAGGWQAIPQRSASAQQNRLFLAVLGGDSSGLQRDFELALQGDAQHWQLTLTPRALLLKQIFNSIRIDGGALVQRIVLNETQGDRTELLLQNSVAADALSDREQHDFTD